MLTDGHPSPHGTLKHSSSRKISSSISHKDLWLISREGSLAELDSALSSLKKNGGNIDARNAFGLTALHIATWRNNVPIVKRLLDAGADPDARDGESGWSSLHRALHFGHLAVASVLIQSGATLTLEDSKHRIPVDLISGPVLQTTGTGLDMVATEVFSWGSGTNYQLGTGNAHIQKLPCKVDALQGSYIKLISSAKFHSVAIGNNGELYTWGFGRGGRLGHPDFDIHSGQAAVITPRQVTVGLGSRRVKDVAAAKHHTVIAIENGEVFTWGSNREGQLGYTSVDTQPTPRRVSSLRSRIITVAAANKHSAAISDMGEVFTWGCNKEGQLGYGTSSSASNYTPRLVEYLKGKVFTQISAAKYHTIVLSKEGEIFTWGHRHVTPKRVIVARNIKKSGNVPLKFHRMERLHVVSVAAGVVHSTALIDDGTLFYWVSSDPDLRCQQLYNMCGKNLVSISAGKYWTAVVTKTGDVYMWDGKKNKTDTPVPARLHGIKQATSVSVGETHLLAVCTLYYPTYPPKMDVNSKHVVVEVGDSLEELDEDFMFDDIQPNRKPTSTQLDVLADKSVPSLKSLCEKTAIEFMLEPRNAVQLLEVADSLAADGLRSYCEEMALRNLSYIFAVSSPTISNASSDVLAMLEKSLDARSSESWSYRRLPTLTETFPAVIDIENEGIGDLRLRDNHSGPMLSDYSDARSDCFLQSDKGTDKAITNQVRALKKKLQQIDMLEEKRSKGHLLDDQQLLKLQTRTELEIALDSLGFPVERESRAPSLVVTEEKGRKQRKNKQKAAQVNLPIQNETCEEMQPMKSLLNIRTLQTSGQKEDISINLDDRCALLEDFSHQSPRGTPKKSANSSRTSTQAQSKKKNKKGGLSLFLSGALDDNPKTIAPPPPPTPKKGPAWGGAKIAKGPTSLRDIQDEQIKTKVTPPLISKEMKPLELIGSETSGHIQLSSFLPPPVSSPVAIISSRTVVIAEVEKSTPPWSSTRMSPVSSRPSLRDIQIQQEKKHSMSHSPQTRTTGFTISSGTVSSSETPTRAKDATPNRWFKPETDAPSSIRSIQIEEKAMKDLKRYYTNVRLVRAQPQGS